ncbi:MAG: hypothetical protein ACFCUW_07850 [Kiloniellaceae bacterium]
MKLFLVGLGGLAALAILSSAGAAAAENCAAPPIRPADCVVSGGAHAAPARKAPRIIYGKHGDTSFEFDSLRPLRRSNASSRQAYFGSGDEYAETLARLQDLLQRMTEQEGLTSLELSPAQEAAREEMSPALLRALALSRQSRQDGEAN